VGGMSIQRDLEITLLAAFKGAAALSTIVTFEDDIRDCLFSNEKLTQGFRDTEMPALNLSASIDPTMSSEFTMTETEHEVPVSIVILTKALKRKPAFEQAKAYQETIERVLNGFRKYGTPLGFNARVKGDLSSSLITIQDNPHCFAVGTTACKISKITSCT
jgi:hypothetical protein